MTALTQPLHSVDEPAHFLRIVQLASGSILPTLGDAKNSTGSMHESGVRDFRMFYGERYNNYFDGSRKTSFDELRRLLDIRATDARSEYLAHSNTTIYFPLAYLAPALAVRLTQIVTDRPLIWMYAGRLANLVSGLAVTILALAMARRGHSLLLVVALLPISLFLTANLSADSLLVPSALLFAVLLYRIGRGESLSKAGHALIFLTSALIGLGKIAYMPLIFLPCAVALLQRRRIDRSVVVLGAGAIALFAIWMIWASLVKDLVFPMREGVAGIDVSGQLTRVLQQPMMFLNALAHTIGIERIARYTFSLVGGVLGWQDIDLPLFAGGLNVLMLVAAIAFDDKPARPRTSTVACVAAACVVSTIAIFFLLYLQWNPVGANFIEGVQGRYFLPLVPVAGLLLPSIKPVRPRLLLATIAAWATGTSALAVFLIYQRYWA